jgi:hypothetical protein
MKKNLKNLMVIRVACCVIGACFILAGRDASAQPYFTNSSPQSGAYQYNQNYTQPLQPSLTLSKQYQAGILAGTIAPTPWFLLTNSFSTNIYTMAPVITANGSSSASQTVCSTNVVTIVSASPTNFVLQTSVSNQTVYWEAVGH